MSLEHFFKNNLESVDKDVYDIIAKENKRQNESIELIASENTTSNAVIEALGNVFTNKYAEGYPGKRYYGGCEFADQIEILAQERLQKIFNAKYSNVQPNSGSQANQGVFGALLSPHDTILGMSLASGGHLTHGAAPNQSGKWFNAIQYGVKKEDGLIDYNQVRDLALQHKPKLIIAGASAYPRQIDFKIFREIADEIDAYFMVDMAHYAGIIAAGVYDSPLEYAHVVTSTTHKTLRGPRGGVILSNYPDMPLKHRKTKSGKDILLKNAINSSIFPGIQGGPLVNVISAKAVAFKQCLEPSFKEYGEQVVKNARVLANTLINRGVNIVTGGTDTHLVLVDLRPKSLTGNIVELSLENAGLTCNKNAIPFDPEKPMVTSGVRLGTPCGTTRGFKEKEFEQVGNLIGDVLDGIVNNNKEEVEKVTRSKVLDLCKQFPIYSN